ncbi:hypothetical protein EP7_005420 [Isosphaeraceae bacterium EP7]
MKPINTGLALRPIGLALVFLVGTAGCGQNASPSDPVEGRTLLLAALEAWKGGEKPETLTSQDPPLHVADGDWMSGLRLVNFRAAEEGRLIGTDVNYDVVLEMKNPRGKSIRRDAVYAVTTHPQRLVLRQDSL